MVLAKALDAGNAIACAAALQIRDRAPALRRAPCGVRLLFRPLALRPSLGACAHSPGACAHISRACARVPRDRAKASRKIDSRFLSGSGTADVGAGNASRCARDPRRFALRVLGLPLNPCHSANAHPRMRRSYRSFGGAFSASGKHASSSPKIFVAARSPLVATRCSLRASAEHPRCAAHLPRDRAAAGDSWSLSFY